MTATCWEILALEETGDERRIRAAWFDLLRQYRPQDDDDTFVRLRGALDEALLLAREWQSLPGTKVTLVPDAPPQTTEDETLTLPFTLPETAADDAAVDAIIQGMLVLYADFSLRRQPALWQQLLAHSVLSAAPVRQGVSDWIILNPKRMPWLPAPVLSLLWNHFDWDNDELREDARLDDAVLDAHFQRLYSGGGFTAAVADLRFASAFSVEQIDAYLAEREAALELAFEQESTLFIERVNALLAEPVEDPDLLCWLATHFRYMGNGEASRDFSQRLIDLDPGKVDGWLRQAQINMDERYYYRAWDDFCQVLRIAPRHILGLKGLAQCLLQLEYLHDARSLYALIYQQVEFDAESQVQILHINTLLHKEHQSALKQNDYGMTACENLAQSYNQTGAYAQCIDFVLVLRENASMNNSLLWRLFKSSIIGHLYRSMFLRHGDFAARYVSAPTYISLGYAFERTGKDKEAREAYRWALNSARHLGSDTFPALEPLLNVMSDLKEWQASIPLLQEALADRPSHAHFWHLLAEAYRYTDRADEALEAADRSIELDTSRWVYFSTRSLILMKKGEFLRALNDLDEVIRGYHSYAWAWHRRGLCLNRLGHHREAIACFEEALDWKIVSDQTALELVKAACECGEYEKAQRGAGLFIKFNGEPEEIAPWLARMEKMAAQAQDQENVA